MTTAELFSWLTFASVIGLAWLAAGVPGALCLIVGALVGNIDVGWIDAYEASLKAKSSSDADDRDPDRVIIRFPGRKSA